MPAKLPKKFTNENPDLEKQLGCVAGMLQMFDRYNFLTGGRANDQRQKKHSSGQNPLKSGRHESEKNPGFSQIFQEKNLSKYLYENEKASLESSRDSSVSSTSSSFSSLEFNKSSQQDACSFQRAFFPKRFLTNSPKSKNSEHHAKSMCFDSRNSTPVAVNAVKDTTKTDTKIFTVKISATEKVKRTVVKNVDSPRPAPIAQVKMPADLDEAIRVLIELKKAPWNFAEQRGKDASFYQESHRSAPPFLMDSQDSKSAAKLRELPRLSLDSRQGSQKSSNLDSNTSLTFEDLDRIYRSPCINRAANMLQDLGSETRHPSIVAKLMGLDEMPFQVPTSRRRSVPPSAPQLISNQFPHPIQRKDSILAEQKGYISFQKAKSEFMYEDVEERLKRNQSLQQNKDLKTLKQMVEAKRAKQQARMTKDTDLPSKVSLLENYTRHTPKDSNQSSRSPRVCKQPAKSCGTTKSFDSPIVIMKPARSLNISDASAHSIMQLEDLSTLPKLLTSCTGRRKAASNITTDKEQSPRVRLEVNTQAVLSTDKHVIGKPLASPNSPRIHSNPAHCLSKMQEGVGEYTEISSRISGAASPRLQQRRMEQENKSVIRSTDRKPIEPVSPRGRLKPKQSQTRKGDGQIDENFPASHKNGSLALRSTVLLQSVQNPAGRVAHNTASLFNHKSSGVSRNQCRLEKEHASIDFGHSSPVSVLDASCYQDEFPSSPVKRTSNSAKDFEYLPDAKLSDKKFRYSLNEEELQVLNFITSKCCDTQNPDHKYVSEILMATGRLNTGCPDNQFHLHSPFPAISPHLFGVLEKNQGYTLRQKHNVEKDHRKLVFDVVNEILSHKESYSNEKWPESLHLQQKRGKQSGQDLLEELCSEIKQLQAGFTKSTSLEDDEEFMFREDILYQAKGWEDFGMEKTKMGLQIERFMLRELINEAVGDITEAGEQGNI